MHAPFSSPSALSWRPAALADAPAVLGLMQDFYAEAGLAFDGRTQGRALDVLLTRPELGAVHLLCTATSGDALGHLVLTRGHSLEFGGLFMLLDELYLRPEIRGRGEGRRALDFAAGQARAAGAHALRLEVEHANARARDAYARAGFTTETRNLMTLRFD